MTRSRPNVKSCDDPDGLLPTRFPLLQPGNLRKFERRYFDEHEYRIRILYTFYVLCERLITHHICVRHVLARPTPHDRSPSMNVKDTFDSQFAIFPSLSLQHSPRAVVHFLATIKHPLHTKKRSQEY